ncbi:hypothetical protein ACFSHR_13880 [Azotobacter chroococcum]
MIAWRAAPVWGTHAEQVADRLPEFRDPYAHAREGPGNRRPLVAAMPVPITASPPAARTSSTIGGTTPEAKE